MDVKKTGSVSGNLQISTDVVEKISKLAALEIDGVKAVTLGTIGVKGFFHKVPIQKAVYVELSEGVAEITVNIAVEYGSRIPSVCDKVQKNIKNSVQNMTSVTVAKVNVIVSGIAAETVANTEE
ncbi:MAG: Asp23/Gls24 family envelope stress response protein [Oscillospiraceae bacterium]